MLACPPCGFFFESREERGNDAGKEWSVSSSPPPRSKAQNLRNGTDKSEDLEVFEVEALSDCASCLRNKYRQSRTLSQMLVSAAPKMGP